MQRSPPPKSTQAIVEREPATTGVGDTGPPSRMSQADAIERVVEVEDGAEAGAVGTDESKPLIRLSPLDAQEMLRETENGTGTTGAIPKRQYNLFPPLDVAGTGSVAPAPPNSIFSRPQSVDPSRVGGRQSALMLDRFELGNPNASPPARARSAMSSRRSMGTPANTRKDIEFIDLQTPGRQWWNSPSVQLQGSTRFEISEMMRMERRDLEEERDRQRLRDTAFQSIEQRRKQQKEERENRKYAAQLKQAEEIERVLETETDAGVTTDTSAVSRSMEKVRRKIAKRRARDQGTQEEETSTTEDDLRGPFRNLHKVVYNLNDRAARDDSEILRRNIRHLDKISAEAVTDGFRKSFAPIEEEIDKRVADSMANTGAAMMREVHDKIQEDLGVRVRKMEENERLSTRVATEKKDQLTPLAIYPKDDATDNIFNKAMNHLNAAAKTIEKTCSFAEQPFNFLMQVAAESNQVAGYYRLSKNQQYGLIFSHIPLRHPVRMLLQMNKSLEDLLSMISTSSNQVYSRHGLEKMINNWRLQNTTENDMYLSLATLGDLLDRNRDDYGFTEPDPMEMFKSIITIIQRQEGLPKFVQDNLHEARLKIRDTDTPAQMYQILVAACHKYIGMKPKNVKLVETAPVQWSQPVQQYQQVQQPYLIPQVYMVDSTAKQQNSGPRKEPWWKQKKKKQEAEKQPEKQDGVKQTDGVKKEEKKVPWRKHQFVEPWPENCPYVSTNGNKLTKEFEKWFEKSCFKCGHSSHSATGCKVYPEKTTVLTLCTRCRQGLHENCKSKKKGLPPKVAAVNKTMAQLSLQPPTLPVPPPGYTVTYSMPPMSVHQPTADSDESS